MRAEAAEPGAADRGNSFTTGSEQRMNQ